MTVLTGRLSSILGTPFGGPGYAVLIKSRMTRRSPGGSVILPLIDRIPMPAEEDGGDGEFTTSLLDPGPIRVELSGSDRHGDGWDITVPEGDGPFELADLIDAQTEWSPMVVSKVGELTAQAREAADRVGTAEQVGVWAQQASTAATTAEQVATDLPGQVAPLVAGALADDPTVASAAALAADAAIEAKAGKLDALQPSGKNLFNPDTDVVNTVFLADGVESSATAARKRTIRYPVAPGQPVSISGLGDAVMHSSSQFMHFWDENNGLVKKVDLPAGHVSNMEQRLLTDWLTEIAPLGSASFSVNLTTMSAGRVPDRLQIEFAPTPTPYRPYHDLKFGVHKTTLANALLEHSTKNLFNGRFWQRIHTRAQTLVNTSSFDDVLTDYIPVEAGKTYTVSGLNPSLASFYNYVHGFASNRVGAGNPAIPITTVSGDEVTFTVTDPAVKFVVVALSVSGGGGDGSLATSLQIQVEEGTVATAYEPAVMPVGGRDIYAADQVVLSKAKEYTDQIMSEGGGRLVSIFNPMDEAVPEFRDTAPITREFGPYGPSYAVQGQAEQDAAGTTLVAQVDGLAPGTRSVSAYLRASDNAGQSTLPKVVTYHFDVPSGQLVNEGSGRDYSKTDEVADYVHPSIEYTSTPVAGYKYWMISSIHPGRTDGGAQWEDEDIFVSNDADTWLRIRSPYESDRADTAPGLVLPEHSLEQVTGRKYAFLPCPANDSVVEISVPETPRGPALDRQTITVTGIPWKHDPAILIDGGYVWIYHTFHLSYPDRPGVQNRFLMLTRTSDGVNWEGVRSDGTTWPVNATTTEQMFTKDDQGRYNWWAYLGTPGDNPHVVKWGEDDYSFYHGANFDQRYEGTTPWSFDFSTPISIGGGTSSFNHPGLLAVGQDLYLLNQTQLYKSTDRGSTWSPMGYHPGWKGNAIGMTYKKAICVGEGGEVVALDVSSHPMVARPTTSVGGYQGRMRRNSLVVQKYPNLTTFLGYAANGLDDGYVDVQIEKVNYGLGTRRNLFVPYVGNLSTNALYNNNHQPVHLIDLDVDPGDMLVVYITMMSRNGGGISFNGLEIR